MWRSPTARGPGDSTAFWPDESNLARVQLKEDGTPDLLTTRPGDSAAEEDPSDPAADPSKFKKFSGGTDSDANP